MIRWRNLFGLRRVEAELDAEVRDHVAPDC